MSKSDNGFVVQKKHIIIAVIIILLLIGGAVILGITLGKENTGASSSPSDISTQTPLTNENGFNPELDEGAQDWTGQQLENKDEGEAEGIKIPGYPSITIPADSQTVQVALLNPEGNPCYFTFELVLKDTEEVLYTSKLVPPGQAIYEITLTRALAAGEYDAVIIISTTDLQTGAALNGANVETLLIAK